MKSFHLITRQMEVSNWNLSEIEGYELSLRVPNGI